MNLPGRHNVQNACAAAAIALEIGVDPATIVEGLARFGGVGRRFSIHPDLALAQGSVMFVDDYGHHPRELRAVIEAARGGWPQRRLVLAFQPHRYTRTRDLLDDFAEVLSLADVVVLTEVYAAGEAPRVVMTSPSAKNRRMPTSSHSTGRRSTFRRRPPADRAPGRGPTERSQISLRNT